MFPAAKVPASHLGSAFPVSDEGLEGFGLAGGSAGGFVSAAKEGCDPTDNAKAAAKQAARKTELKQEQTRMQG